MRTVAAIFIVAASGFMTGTALDVGGGAPPRSEGAWFAQGNSHVRARMHGGADAQFPAHSDRTNRRG